MKLEFITERGFDIKGLEGIYDVSVTEISRTKATLYDVVIAKIEGDMDAILDLKNELEAMDK